MPSALGDAIGAKVMKTGEQKPADNRLSSYRFAQRGVFMSERIDALTMFPMATAWHVFFRRSDPWC
jgi:hypothetical protein